MNEENLIAAANREPAIVNDEVVTTHHASILPEPIVQWFWVKEQLAAKISADRSTPR